MIRTVVLGSSGSLPTPKSNPSCFAVKWGGVYLFDCSEGCQRQLMKYGVSYAGVNAIFISHLHADHFLGVFGLVQTLNFIGRRETLYIYGPIGTKKFFSTVFAIKELQPDFEIIVTDVEASKKSFYENELFSVKAFEVKHNAPHSIGFVLQGNSYRRFDLEKCKKLGVQGRDFTELQQKGTLEKNGKTLKFEQVTYAQGGKKIVYTGDTMQCASIASNAKNADLLVHDACFLEKDKSRAKEKMHCTSLDAGKNAKKAKVKKLLLTHFSNRYENLNELLEEAKSVFGNTELAEKGKEILI